MSTTLAPAVPPTPPLPATKLLTIADVAVLPNASAPVTVYAVGVLAPLDHAKLLDV